GVVERLGAVHDLPTAVRFSRTPQGTTHQVTSSFKMVGEKKQKKTRSALNDVVTRQYTIHLHRRVHDVAFKKKAPKGVKEVIKFAQQAMGTKDVRLDPKLNHEIWKLGVKDVPRRLRVQLERKRNDDEDAKEKLYTYATFVPGPSKGLITTIVDQE
ncbi:unnamed protein product, partial [Tilletia caries]